MKFYQGQHELYCGIDLHARKMYGCVLAQDGEILAHRNMATSPDTLRSFLKPYRDRDLVVGVESTFNWYWLSDLCEEENLPFVLGHALAMKAIHGGKTKNDKQDSLMLASLLRGGNFPKAYVYPKVKRAQRDLLRRRNYLVQRRAEMQAHIRNTGSQYNLPPIKGPLRYRPAQERLAGQFPNEAAQLTIDADVEMINALTQTINKLEKRLLAMARFDEPAMFFRLKSVPGVGDILAMVILYEIGNIRRFADVGNFLSYCRLVPGRHESAGKKYGSPGRKMGNANLKWAFSEAVSLMLREYDVAKTAFVQFEKRYGRGKALSILAARLGRAVYFMLRRGDVFDPKRFLQLNT